MTRDLLQVFRRWQYQPLQLTTAFWKKIIRLPNLGNQFWAARADNCKNVNVSDKEFLHVSRKKYSPFPCLLSEYCRSWSLFFKAECDRTNWVPRETLLDTTRLWGPFDTSRRVSVSWYTGQFYVTLARTFAVACAALWIHEHRFISKTHGVTVHCFVFLKSWVRIHAQRTTVLFSSISLL